MPLELKKAIDPTMSAEISRLALMRGILDYHGTLPKNEKGVAPITLRQMATHHLSNYDKVANEYFIMFGSHGYAVIDRRLDSYAGDSEDMKEYIKSIVHAQKRKIEEYYTSGSQR